MLKAEVDNGKRALFVKGSLPDTVAAIASIINGVYWAIRKDSPAAAEAFKTMLTALFLHPESPLWEEEKSDGAAIQFGGVFNWRPHD